MTQIPVDNEIHLPREALPAKQMEKLIQRLTVPNPEYIARKRMGKWLGGVPESIECFRFENGSIAIPRGAARLLKELTIETGTTLHYVDRRLSFPFVAYPIAISPRAYQAEAIARMTGATQGVVVMPCGGGKSLTGVGVVIRLGQPTIFLVHTLDLVEQWRDLLNGLGVQDVGIVCDGVNKPEMITLATVQTLAGRDAGDPLFRQFGCVIQDEGHHVPGYTFRDVLNRFPAKHRFALTATPDRADGLTDLLFHYVGPILHEVDFGFLVKNGFLIEPEI
ncbi:MAG: DEAD/DEAH box helicase family protein, partial [Myxococcales bacterium]|nr:DEAD/DEAH box helicase family protein [Myxococcales bacterium]